MKILKRSNIMLLIVLLIGLVMIGHTPDLTLTNLKSKWATGSSVFIMVDGISVHMRDEGPRNDPNPIVLLHGTSSSLHTWEGWAQTLKGKRRVIRIDLPGFGLTGPFPDDKYTMERYVAFLGRFLDTLNIQNCVLVGNSFGGAIAWHEALIQPLRINKLILIDAVGYPDRPKSIPIGFRIAKIPLLNKVMEYTLPRNMVDSSVKSVYSDPSKVTPELVDRYYELTLRAGNRHALVQRFRQAPNGNDFDQIKSITQPTLILWGQNDYLIPVVFAHQFNKDIRDSQLVILENLGHVPHEENPQKTVNAIKVFLGIE